MPTLRRGSTEDGRPSKIASESGQRWPPPRERGADGDPGDHVEPRRRHRVHEARRRRGFELLTVGAENSASGSQTVMLEGAAVRRFSNTHDGGRLPARRATSDAYGPLLASHFGSCRGACGGMRGRWSQRRPRGPGRAPQHLRKLDESLRAARRRGGGRARSSRSPSRPAPAAGATASSMAPTRGAMGAMAAPSSLRPISRSTDPGRGRVISSPTRTRSRRASARRSRSCSVARCSTSLRRS